MGLKFSDVWPTVHAERAQLVHDLVGVPEDAWSTPSLCPGWDVHDVVAHVVDTALITRVAFVRRMVLARMDFDRANEAGIAKTKRTDPRDTLEALRAVVDATRTAPAPAATRLVEAFVHGEDIRRPLDIPSDHPADAVTEALRFQLKTAVGFGGGKERVAGLRLTASDSDFVHGTDTDAEVRGNAIDLLLAVSGRQLPAGTLTGPGAALLTT